MSDSAFNIIGPVMIGPSSSHTAGAVRLGLIARSLVEGEPALAKIGLHGSFAATGDGHGTKLALVSGLLGLAPDDDRLAQSHALAQSRQLDFTFETIDLGEDYHPNGVSIEIHSRDGEKHLMLGASIGGGAVKITTIDRFETHILGDSPTFILWHQDRIGYLAAVTAVLAKAEANIARIITSRHTRGQQALTTIELDSYPDLAPVTLNLNAIAQTQRVRLTNIA